MSSLIESTNPSLEVTPNGPRHSSHESDHRLNYSEYNTYQVGEESYASPSKFGTKKYIIKEHIKSRLDFDDFGMAESPVTCASGASLSETNGEARANPDMDDFLNLSILDTDVSLSYLVSFIDAQVADPTEQATFDGVSSLISSVHDGSMKIDGAFSNPPLIRVGILSQKDMNCNGDDDGQPSKPVSACIKTDNPGRKKTGYSSDQENVPIL
ncbi:hypothetical protein EJ110_NYTH00075 [Nymphaea thermarum]|nr:hypothetical protein EJ110_NYTH00075 [Nymphaea thermarum]